MQNKQIPYRCYGLMRPDGGWSRWRFCPATVAMRQQMLEQADGRILFESVQLFHPPIDAAGLLRWSEVSRQYGGEKALPHLAPLYFDIDCEGGLNKALLLTQALHEFFTGELGISPEHIRVFFSGSKGAHLLVHPEALGIQASATLTREMKPIALALCKRLAREYGAPELSADDRVYSLPRMLRSENQLNPRSGRYKVRLTPEELAAGDVEAIKRLAASPRESDSPGGEDIPISSKALAWWEEQLREARAPREFQKQTARVTGVKIRPDGFAEDELAGADMPDCIARLLKSAPPTGVRNRVELQLACWARSAGKGEVEATSLLARWIQRNRPELPASQANRRASGIVHSAYAGKYGFSCAASRLALNVVGDTADCPSCKAVRRKHPQLIASLRVAEVCPVSEVTVSLEEARERVRTLAFAACAC